MPFAAVSRRGTGTSVSPHPDSPVIVVLSVNTPAGVPPDPAGVREAALAAQRRSRSWRRVIGGSDGSAPDADGACEDGACPAGVCPAGAGPLKP